MHSRSARHSVYGQDCLEQFCGLQPMSTLHALVMQVDHAWTITASLQLTALLTALFMRVSWQCSKGALIGSIAQ